MKFAETENQSSQSPSRQTDCIIGDDSPKQKFAAMSEVMELLRVGGGNFTDLEPIRNHYMEQFGNDQTWTYPFSHDDHQGGVFLPVQEGILYLPYDEIHSETFEQFVLEDAHLMDREETDRLMRIMDTQYVSLIMTLESVREMLDGLRKVANDPVDAELEHRKGDNDHERP